MRFGDEDHAGTPLPGLCAGIIIPVGVLCG
jgi:hypothetical protein